ncbi:Dephospho-CoA kinase [Dickeya solani]|nr:Dephospho-CoA kinase [Dickeya solani]QKO15377.1 Dephospho-CoA kinase [Dickeya solani]
MAYIVALTGGIGSGKSTVAQGFATLGATIVDADVIARQVVAPGQPALTAIVEYFGLEILQPDGALNRSALRERIFSSPEDKRWLNALLHPLIQQETRRQLAAVTTPYALWVVPLLVENQLQGQAQRILVVDIPWRRNCNAPWLGMAFPVLRRKTFWRRRPTVNSGWPALMILSIIIAIRAYSLRGLPLCISII